MRIELASAEPDALNKLKQLGFELVSDRGGKTLVGRIPIEKLSDLADVDGVKLVLPKL